MTDASERGAVGALERSWSGGRGAVPWTLALAPLALAYGAAASIARARAVASRRPLGAAPVLCVGGLSVGGSGKTSLARWLAGETLARGGRPAVVSRGHRREDGTAVQVLPDAHDYPAARLAARAGDEAAALRAALPSGAVVAVGRDRRQAALRAVRGYGATSVLLDDGWEQGFLAWDRLWVALDPARPFGNGWTLPAGPLRRPPSTLVEADAVAFVLEPGDEVGTGTLEAVRRFAPRAAVLRFRRSLDRVSELGDRGAGAGGLAPGAPVALVTGVGSPSRVERLVAASGCRMLLHAAFPDHARWSMEDLARSLERAAYAGAAEALITEKDEARWPRGLASPIPVRVLRATIAPIDAVDPYLIAPGQAGGASDGDAVGLPPSSRTRPS